MLNAYMQNWQQSKLEILTSFAEIMDIGVKELII